MDPKRFNHSNCSEISFSVFLGAMKAEKSINIASYKPSAKNCHFVRYNIISAGERASVVYDTKAKILTFTAPDTFLGYLNDLYYKAVASMQKNERGNQPIKVDALKKNQPKTEKKTTDKPISTNEKNSKITSDKTEITDNKKSQITGNKKSEIKGEIKRTNTDDKNQKTANEKKSGIKGEIKRTNTDEKKQKGTYEKQTESFRENKSGSAIEKKPEKANANKKGTLIEKKSSETSDTLKPRETKQRNEFKAEINSKKAGVKNKTNVNEENSDSETTHYKNGYSVKNFTSDKFNALVKRIRSSGIKIKLSNVSDKGLSTETKSYSIEDDKRQKVILRYMPVKKVIQLQGKRSSLFGEVQVILNNDTDYKTAVNSHIELTGEQKRAGTIQRQLKKALPNAYPFLSEQSKIDLSIGLMDITNNEVKLSDYSVLLVPPYRGLERLIFDLQRSNGIDVKMIGQAFERPDGIIYELKSGYKKKIDSVVYCEVMTALYTEYFEKRNFYAHADNSVDSVNRVIGDKEAAKVIFDGLLKIIDYNCKKLSEIGFKIQD